MKGIPAGGGIPPKSDAPAATEAAAPAGLFTDGKACGMAGKPMPRGGVPPKTAGSAGCPRKGSGTACSGAAAVAAAAAAAEALAAAVAS